MTGLAVILMSAKKQKRPGSRFAEILLMRKLLGTDESVFMPAIPFVKPYKKQAC